ncbi:MAG: GNAT family N-acetyltransferase [Sterolibacteriaceae bacterium]|uniref:GNAT family N-acetyltransferase n=1 Tax=Candidatus Methylophosphatis roskildensis TaxID=2899263 RepID=A0A9D7E6S8_9PROT|nr:GNAT family N-acetyltransferase [Candidatus Methylophosphatis roskildensis]MBK7237965.1 GNAT family N-acetyltransferase [Sterolibacteriaceae bacterium]
MSPSNVGHNTEALLALRSRAPSDEAFLFLVYSSTREDELAAAGWDASEKLAFLAMQFRAQDTHYRTHYRDATCHIVELAGQPVGRIYVYRGQDEFRILDVSLLPAHRGRGLGATLLRTLQAESALAGVPIVIHVQGSNRALNLYMRLGFAPIDGEGIYVRMVWPPPA